jgi:type VI secretion system secreted protein VgrG
VLGALLDGVGGKGWGQFSVPRIGQEVLVDFLEGDPTGRCRGARVQRGAAAAVQPGGGGVVSGMRSKTHKGSGYNAMEMDDTAGKEKIDIHAQYDMNTTVGHDDTQAVANDRTITVGAKHTETIEGDTSITVASGNYSLDVAAGTATVHVNGAVRETFDATQETTVAQKIAIASTGAAIDVSAATEIVLSVGAASITMKADGTIAIDGVKITIDGAQIAVAGTAQASMEVAAQSLKLNPAMAELAGAMVKSTASAVNEITGATVKLN